MNPDEVGEEQERERFIAVLGHDLRNPLAAVLMSAEVLRGRVGEREQVIVDRIKRSATRMQRMIRDLVDFARLRSDAPLQLRPSNGDLAELFRNVVAELKQAYPYAQVEIRGPARVAGSWDLERLAQVVSNLVGNAIVHGTREAIVMVSLSEPAPEEVRIEVKNQGVPPEPDNLEGLFLPFRSGRGEGNRDSLGLGLFIARAVVKAHGGGVALRVENGSTLATVDLPRHTHVHG